MDVEISRRQNTRIRFSTGSFTLAVWGRGPESLSSPGVAWSTNSNSRDGQLRHPLTPSERGPLSGSHGDVVGPGGC